MMNSICHKYLNIELVLLFIRKLQLSLLYITLYVFIKNLMADRMEISNHFNYLFLQTSR
jgi:hypothetical protein